MQETLKEGTVAVDRATDGKTVIHAEEIKYCVFALLNLGLPKAVSREVLKTPSSRQRD